MWDLKTQHTSEDGKEEADSQTWEQTSSDRWGKAEEEKVKGLKRYKLLGIKLVARIYCTTQGI